MKLVFIFIFNLLLSLLCPSSACELLLQAFSSVSNFHLPNTTTIPCSQVHDLTLPSANLTGTVSWMFLSNISTLRSLDLSGNSLLGSIPGGFWSSSPSLLKLNLAGNRLGGPLRFEPGPLTHLNLSGNRFTAAFGVSGLSQLSSLDLSRNNVASVPAGLEKLHTLSFLDVSFNLMSGVFPRDFPAIGGLKFLNVSFNNLTGRVNDSAIKKFGSSAFIKAGSSLTFSASSTSREQEHKTKTHKVAILVTAVAVSVIVVLAMVCVVTMFVMRRRRKRKGWKGGEQGVRAPEEVLGWVAEARWGAPVVVFEKPLMELTFSDLAAATSGFGKEAQLAEGARSGPVYRAVLSGDLQVVVRVMESVRGAEEREAVAAFRELARLRHPNLLPLLGYCIAGKEKLVLYEYMERGDLHQWLHELPAGHPNSEDWTGDTWEPHQTMDKGPATTATARDWPVRHKVALGIARGLAFLHQGWAGSRQAIVHGHLVPSNILLDENLEPRIADFATGGGEETTESNVYSYGMLVMELVTGREKWTAEEVEKVRKSVRDGKGLKEVDFRMRVEDGSEEKWEKEMIECLRVGYLCTAQSPEKRPTMQQVVGLLKDIYPSPSDASTSS